MLFLLRGFLFSSASLHPGLNVVNQKLYPLWKIRTRWELLWALCLQMGQREEKKNWIYTSRLMGAQLREHRRSRAILSSPTHNGVALFHSGSFICSTERNGSTSSPHTASRSCSVSLDPSQRGWVCGIGQRQLDGLKAGFLLDPLQGPAHAEEGGKQSPATLKTLHKGFLKTG